MSVLEKVEVSSGVDPQIPEVLKALAHPIRLGIVRRLSREPDTCACDFTEYFDVAQPTISSHLKVLRQAGVVTTRRVGTTICYSLAPDAIQFVADALDTILADAGTSSSHERDGTRRKRPFDG